MDYIRKLGISPNFDSESLRCTNTVGKFYILLTARKVFLNVRTVIIMDESHAVGVGVALHVKFDRGALNQIILNLQK